MPQDGEGGEDWKHKYDLIVMTDRERKLCVCVCVCVVMSVIGSGAGQREEVERYSALMS